MDCVVISWLSCVKNLWLCLTRDTTADDAVGLTTSCSPLNWQVVKQSRDVYRVTWPSLPCHVTRNYLPADPQLPVPRAQLHFTSRVILTWELRVTPCQMLMEHLFSSPAPHFPPMMEWLTLVRSWWRMWWRTPGNTSSSFLQPVGGSQSEGWAINIGQQFPTFI